MSGTPTVAATANFTVQVTDSLAATATQALSILVNAAPVFTTPSSMPGGTTGVAYSQALANSGGTAPFTWSLIAGALPAGLTLAGATGIISGTPQTASTANFTMRILDNAGSSDSKAFSIVITSNLSITTSTPLTSGAVNAAYSQTMASSGGFGAYTWALTAGTLPAGLALTGATGIISGTPTTAGTSNFTIQSTDAGGNAAPKALALTIINAGHTNASAISGAAAVTNKASVH
jgi:hypothetical protein